MSNSAFRAVARLERAVPVSDFIDRCVDEDKFAALCRGCANYGALWSCPPFDFSAGEFWRAHTALLLYGYKLTVPSDELIRTYSPDELQARCTEMLLPLKRTILNELLSMERAMPRSTALSAGSCDECAQCARSYAPCAKTDRMRYSIEALGGDVAKALELYFKEELLWAKDGRLPRHFILLGGLLMRE
ncbi:MAG: DUF2284 domain-containing protein [Clostridia bacterium]|nr:DUF2284 domain-containing protein [Clostridia bacterium]